jgi:hypothetical protein
MLISPFALSGAIAIDALLRRRPMGWLQ